MRTEKEIMDLIINFAKKDERIRGVLMNGSRANPNVERDIFQDFDIAYMVTDVEPFKDEDYVVPYFGDIMIMQKPEDKILQPPIGDGRYIYLMQFIDGNRIDMSFINVNEIEEQIEDSLTKVLLDKDNFIPYLAEPNEESYYIEKPKPKLYDDCCNEFIWGLGSHIPKTIWRKELPLLKELIEVVLRKPLIKMLEWSIGIETDYKSSIGKGGKNLEKLLEPEVWDRYKKTYANYQYDNIWESLFIFHNLFKETAKYVADNCEFEFLNEQLENAFNFLKHVKELPQDTNSIF